MSVSAPPSNRPQTPRAMARIGDLAAIASKTFRIAQGPREKASVLAFTAGYLADQMRSGSAGAGDRSIVLHDIRFFVGPGELIPITEVLLDRCYDQLPSFIAKPGWSVVDVGANVGAFTLLQASRGATVHSFEPNPNCFRRLSSAVAANAIGGRVHVHNFAVSDHAGKAQFRVTDGYTLLGSLVWDANPGGVAKFWDVNVVSLDEVLPGYGVGAIDLLKIDVEGAELDVLEGARTTLDRVARAVMEYHPGIDTDEIDRVMLSHGLKQVLHQSTDPGWGLLYYER